MRGITGGCFGCDFGLWSCGNRQGEVYDGTTTPSSCWYCAQPSNRNKGCKDAWYGGTCAIVVSTDEDKSCGQVHTGGQCYDSYPGRVCRAAVLFPFIVRSIGMQRGPQLVGFKADWQCTCNRGCVESSFGVCVVVVRSDADVSCGRKEVGGTCYDSYGDRVCQGSTFQGEYCPVFWTTPNSTACF